MAILISASFGFYPVSFHKHKFEDSGTTFVCHEQNLFLIRV